MNGQRKIQQSCLRKETQGTRKKNEDPKRSGSFTEEGEINCVKSAVAGNLENGSE